MTLKEQIEDRLAKQLIHHREDIALFVKLREEIDTLRKSPSLKIETARNCISIYIVDMYSYRFKKQVEVYYNSNGVFVATQSCNNEWEHARVATFDAAVSALTRVITKHLTVSERYSL